MKTIAPLCVIHIPLISFMHFVMKIYHVIDQNNVEALAYNEGLPLTPHIDTKNMLYNAVKSPR